MRRRLRKKRKLGEFRQYIFRVVIRTEGLDQVQGLDFLDCWLETAVEPYDLGFGGGGRQNDWDGYIQANRKTATEEHRRLIEDWLKAEPRVCEYGIGPLIDGNIDPGDEIDVPLIVKSARK